MKLAVFSPFTKLPSLLPQPLSFQRNCPVRKAGWVGPGATGVRWWSHWSPGSPRSPFPVDMMSGEPAVTVIKACYELSPSKCYILPN